MGMGHAPGRATCRAYINIRVQSVGYIPIETAGRRALEPLEPSNLGSYTGNH
eukprot:SAG31_NODE_2140_length_6350_cov_2.239962_3_plen_52_part_00